MLIYTINQTFKCTEIVIGEFLHEDGGEWNVEAIFLFFVSFWVVVVQNGSDFWCKIRPDPIKNVLQRHFEKTCQEHVGIHNNYDSSVNFLSS